MSSTLALTLALASTLSPIPDPRPQPSPDPDCRLHLLVASGVMQGGGRLETCWRAASLRAPVRRWSRPAMDGRRQDSGAAALRLLQPVVRRLDAGACRTPARLGSC